MTHTHGSSHHRNISRRIRDAISDSARANDSHITEVFGSLGHLGVLFLAFGFVIVLFMWKEGKLAPNSRTSDMSELPKVEPTAVLKQVPPADVGMRMIFDQANGELGTDSAKFATTSATPQMLQEMVDTENETEQLPALDLVGPWYCSAQTADGNTQIYIRDMKMKFVSSNSGVTVQTVLSDDCIYTWGSGANTRQCGMKQYVTLLAGLSGSEGLDIGSIIASSLSEGEEGADYAELIKTCRNSPVSDATFAIPEGVQWEEIATDDLLNIFQ